MSLDELDTPCALVDLEVLDRNARAMADRARLLGVRLRPHVKTHKSVEAARIQVAGSFGGITVSTMAEARRFAEAGFRDITYAVPLAPQRIGLAAELTRRLDRFGVLLDHPDTLRILEEYGAGHDVTFRAWLKVDCGGGRAGVDPESEDAISLAARLSSSARVEFLGILTHAGHAYRCRNPEEIRRVAAVERDVMVRFAEKLRGAGIPVPEVSIGSTPTITLVDRLDGITEVRPGNYLFHDVFQATIGTCSLDDVAFSVLATVIGRYPQRNRIVLDAGSLALSSDPGPVHVDPKCGFGHVRSAAGATDHHPRLRVVSLSQEHGLVAVEGGPQPGEFPIGARLRILPNHSCLAAALHERYFAIRDGRLVATWEPIRGW